MRLAVFDGLATLAIFPSAGTRFSFEREIEMGFSMQGIKVLDFSMGIAGPKAGMLCALQGAEVVKVESSVGDWSRTLGPQFQDLSAYATVYNRGKRSLSLDLKDPTALQAVRAMASEADVVIEAFRPGVMQRLGLGYEAVASTNPDVVYLSVNGFGSAGPLVDAPATDAVLQAFSGFMYCNKGGDGTPRRLDLFIIDLVTGLYAYQAVASALLEIARTGKGGRHIECSLLGSALALQAAKILEQHLATEDQSYYVPLGVYETSDGHVSLSVRRDDHFAQLCHALGRSDLVACKLYTLNEQRIARKSELESVLRVEFRKHSAGALSAILSSIDILHSRVNTYAEMLGHPQLDDVAAMDWIVQSGVGSGLPMARVPGADASTQFLQAPHLGEHSVAVLKDWGVNASVVDNLLSRGVVVQQLSGSRTSALP